MAENDDFLRFLASWALVHETADEGWKAAVTRGAEQGPGEMGSGPDAFVDGLSAIIAQRKEQLKAELARGGSEPGGSRAEVGGHLDELRFEVAEVRARLEAMQASLDALLDRAGPPSGAVKAGAKPAVSAAPAPQPDAAAKGEPAAKGAETAAKPAESAAEPAEPAAEPAKPAAEPAESAAEPPDPAPAASEAAAASDDRPAAVDETTLPPDAGTE